MPGLQPFSSSLLLCTVLAGLQRQLAQPKAKKVPITMEMLVAIVQSSNGLLTDLRLMALALLAFAAFLGYDELIRLHAYDMSFALEHTV